MTTHRDHHEPREYHDHHEHPVDPNEHLISVEEALERILVRFAPLDVEERPIVAALGQVLAEDVVGGFNVPPLDNSSMDGYAVRAADVASAAPDHPVELEILGIVAAGYVSGQEVRPGTTLRIMTGAPIPPGADAVVPFEETDEVQQKERGLHAAELRRIGIRRTARVGNNVRRAGGDIRAGDTVLEAGALIGPAHMGVLATAGHPTVRVIRRPVVAILATGDELVEPGQQLAPGQIYNANAYTLAGLVQQAGGIPRLLGIARDTIESLEEHIAAGLDADLLLTSAGVSTGEYDLVKDVLTRGGEMDFWRVRIRPGKPLAFGFLKGQEREVPHIGLPGNPVSCMVAFESFVRPALRRMLGHDAAPRPSVMATMQDTVQNDDGRRFYLRTILSRNSDGEYVVRTTGAQGSDVLTGMAKANSLAIIPEDWPRVQPGDRVRVQLLDGYEHLLA